MRKHEYVINLGGNLQRRARAFQQSVERFADKSSARLERLKRTATTTSRRLERMGMVTAVAGGATMLAAGKGVADLDDRINRLGIDFNLAGDELEAFKKKAKATILSTAVDYSVASDEIISGMEAIAQKTGDLEFANKNIEVLARTVSATDAQGSDMGGLLSEINKMGIKNPKKVQEILDVMIVQGKNGAFTLKDLSAQGERVFAAYGPKNLQQVRELGAALQTIRSSTGSSEQAVTAFEAFLRTLRDGKKSKLLQDNGLQVFDPELLKQGIEQLRPINEIMTEIVTKANGKTSVLSKVLGDSEAVKALMGLVNELNATGDVGVRMQKILNAEANDQAAKDSADAQHSLNKQILRIRMVLERYANNNLAPMIAELADMLNRIEPDQVTFFLNAIKYAAGALIAFSVAAKAKKGYDTVRSFVGSATGKGGLLAPGSTPAHPLYAILINDKGGLSNTSSSNKKSKSIKSKLGKTAMVLGEATVVGSLAYSLGREAKLYERTLQNTSVSDTGGKLLAKVAAFFGYKEAEDALLREKQAKLQEQKSKALLKNYYATKEQYKNQLDVKVTVEDGRVVVKSVNSTTDQTDMSTSYTLGDV